MPMPKLPVKRRFVVVHHLYIINGHTIAQTCRNFESILPHSRVHVRVVLSSAEKALQSCIGSLPLEGGFSNSI